MSHSLSHVLNAKAGIDRNVTMLIMGHSNSNDMSARYDTVDEGDLLTAVDQYETYLKNVDQRAKK